MDKNPTYRRNRHGQWVVFGPAAVVKPGKVQVHTKAGKVKTEPVSSVGKPFTVDGVSMVYGYIDTEIKELAREDRQMQREDRKRSQRSRSRCDRCRCHSEPNAGQPGSIMFDGCDYCGCEAV